MKWSLYKRVGEDDSDIFDNKGEKLSPLRFSNGKTQEDIVNEVLDAIKENYKIIFIKGVCGSGKSAIALNLAKEFKKSAIVVPIKTLQEQYERDYTKKMFVLKDNNEKLKISVIKGRANFSCKFQGGRADEKDLPCLIEIREKNLDILLDYIKQNKSLSMEDFSEINDIKRTNVASICPYWSPLLPADAKPKGLDDVKKMKFKTISDKEYALFQRRHGCSYFEQYGAYADSDVLVFNSAKYLIEISIGRKPKTDIDIIDECDEFLDNFASEKKINLQKLNQALINLNPTDQEHKNALKQIIYDLDEILMSNEKIDCEKLKNTKIMNFIKKILKNPNLAEDEELNYYNSAVEVARDFDGVLDDTYVSVERFSSEETQSRLYKSKKQESVNLVLVTINLGDKMKDLTDQGNVLVMMTGSLHSESVLKGIFGLKDFKIIEAETQSPGKITNVKLGMEMSCAYSSFKGNLLTRDRYLKMLDCSLAHCKGQTLVHVNSFGDLPTNEELEKLKLENLISQERLKELQSMGTDSIKDFLEKKIKTLFTTKCSRGVDFPGDKCQNIVLTKYPYPNISSPFWKILKKENPDKFNEFYIDKANRELIQKVARGVRFKGDYVNLLSPDSRVINKKLT